MRSSKRAAAVAQWFSLDPKRSWRIAAKPAIPLPRPPEPGEILLLSGPSGAGKSTLLRTLARAIPAAARIDVHRIPLPRRIAVVDCFPRLTLEQSLRALSRVGLAEAHSYLLRPRQLSTGQQWRLRLALALESARSSKSPDPCLICDEFAALLDRITARIVARLLRNLVNTHHLRALIATSHEDLLHALNPDHLISCDFGQTTTHAPIP